MTDSGFLSLTAGTDVASSCAPLPLTEQVWHLVYSEQQQKQQHSTHSQRVTLQYLVAIKRHITVFASPLLQVCDLQRMIRGHVKRSVNGIVHVIGAVEEEECHQDEDGQEDHHPVALLALQQ